MRYLRQTKNEMACLSFLKKKGWKEPCWKERLKGLLVLFLILDLFVYVFLTKQASVLFSFMAV